MIATYSTNTQAHFSKKKKKKEKLLYSYYACGKACYLLLEG